MSRRELAWGAGRAVAFLGGATSLALFTHSTRQPDWWLVVGLVAAYAVAYGVEFETGAGAAIPNQLVLVPMLFVLPTGWVPLAAWAGSILPELLPGRTSLRSLFGSTWSTTAVLAISAALVVSGEGSPQWSSWPGYLAALVVFSVVDACVTLVQRTIVLRQSCPPFRSFLQVSQLDALFAPIGFLAAIAAQSAPAAAFVPLVLLVLLRLLTTERTQRVDQARDLSHAYRGTALLLGSVIDADDGYTGFHSRGVVQLAISVADALGLDAEDRQRTEFAALLHDVGKIKIPKEIINKPGPLTADEWSVVRRHPGDGAAMLDSVGGFLSDIGDIVRHHHERWDGAGYPDGLTGAEIPLIARIVSVCDAFSAITTDRAYRRGRPPSEALTELRNSAGTQFDPNVVAALCTIVAQDLEQGERAA